MEIRGQLRYCNSRVSKGTAIRSVTKFYCLIYKTVDHCKLYNLQLKNRLRDRIVKVIVLELHRHVPHR
jgi:hypothetical protein